MLSGKTKDKLARTRSCCSCTVGIWRKFASMLVLTASMFTPSLGLAADYSATIGSGAGSYCYSLTGSGGISYKSFTSSESWLTPSSTRVSTSGGSWTVVICYSVTANTSSSSRTATLSGTISGQQIRIAITQSGCNGCSSEKHVMTLYRNNSSGDGAGARRTVTEGSDYTLPKISSLGWTRSGYTFKGWATSRGATTAKYGDGARISITSSLYSLYAVREPNAKKHVMTLYRNNSSGDGAGARRTVTDNAYYALPTISSLGWTRSGYDFLGWSTSRGGSAVYGDGERIKVASSLNSLYAVWKAQTYIVKLHRNNSSGDGATAGRTYTVGKSRALPKIQTELKWAPRSGYEFLGWSTSKSATSATYSDGQSVSLSSTSGSTVHLYAVWKKKTCCDDGYSASIGSQAGSYQYSIPFTGSGNMSISGFSSSVSWLTKNSTGIKTSSGGGTFYIIYSVTANTSTSSRTATLSGTFGGYPITVRITQSGR